MGHCLIVSKEDTGHTSHSCSDHHSWRAGINKNLRHTQMEHAASIIKWNGARPLAFDGCNAGKFLSFDGF